jgi:molybdopterin converting factor small subunit
MISPSQTDPPDRGAVIRVEFFGVPRQRAGVADVELSLSGNPPTLGDALRQLTRHYPQLVGECLTAEGRLMPACVANLDGRSFVRDPTTTLIGVSALLLLSADAGG